MRVLLHIGLNKCASTYVQDALDQAHGALAQAGVWYPWQAGPPCQYGLSRHYGFGPGAEAISPVSVGDLVAEARLARCDRMIVSSEYLSLFHPAGVQRIAADLRAAGATAEVVVLRRELVPWVRSLFNQYVKTVEGGRHLASIDAFVEQVLTNRAVDIARRVRQWQETLGHGRVGLYAIGEGASPASVLAPFSRFIGADVPEPVAAEGNASLDGDRLFRVGQLRQQPRSDSRDAEIARLIAGAPAPAPAPSGYTTISHEMVSRLVAAVGLQADALGWQGLALPDEAACPPAVGGFRPAGSPRLHDRLALTGT